MGNLDESFNVDAVQLANGLQSVIQVMGRSIDCAVLALKLSNPQFTSEVNRGHFEAAMSVLEDIGKELPRKVSIAFEAAKAEEEAYEVAPVVNGAKIINFAAKRMEMKERIT